MVRVMGIIFMIYLIFGLLTVGVCLWYEMSTTYDGQDLVTAVHNEMYAEKRTFRCWNKRKRVHFTVVICFVGILAEVLVWPALAPEIPDALKYLIKKIRNK